jgi:NAD(P)-dependent dehydrogenase (short-subunit alcohol dehydrogenase family)
MSSKEEFDFRLDGRTALVTGASKGIGKALAIGMAKAGADLLVHYGQDREGAVKTAATIEELDRQVSIYQADLASVAEIRRMFERIDSKYGHLDILVNNAAITGWTSLFEVTEEGWDQVIDTNLKGTFFCSLEAAKIMKRTSGGSIINVSTNCAALGVKNLVAYATSKGGIHALTKQMAVELASWGIRVNTFAPGPTMVDRNLRDDPDYNQTWGQMVPLGRAALPEEMVGAALFLASDASSYMTGQVFYVDGGWAVTGRIPEDYMDQSLEKNR